MIRRITKNKQHFHLLNSIRRKMVSRKDMRTLNQMKCIIWERGEVTHLELQNLMKPRLSIGLYNMYKPYLIAMFADSIGYDKASKLWTFIYPANLKVVEKGQNTLDIQN